MRATPCTESLPTLLGWIHVISVSCVCNDWLIIWLYYSTSYHVISYHIISYHVMSCHSIVCYIISCVGLLLRVLSQSCRNGMLLRSWEGYISREKTSVTRTSQGRDTFRKPRFSRSTTRAKTMIYEIMALRFRHRLHWYLAFSLSLSLSLSLYIYI